jgi:hypothetical protein
MSDMLKRAQERFRAAKKAWQERWSGDRIPADAFAGGWESGLELAIQRIRAEACRYDTGAGLVLWNMANDLQEEMLGRPGEY